MISMLSEGFWGEKLYAAMAAMRFAANFQMSDEPLQSSWYSSRIGDVPDNIRFVDAIAHLDVYGGNYHNPTQGQFVSRTIL